MSLCEATLKCILALFEELRLELKLRYGDSLSVPDATIWRALRFDLNLTRKTITKKERECVPRGRREYVGRLLPFTAVQISLFLEMELLMTDGKLALLDSVRQLHNLTVFLLS